MGERVNKVEEMIEEHEASFESLKESTKQYDEQINQYVVESNQRKLHIERLEEEMRKSAKNLDFERAMQLRDIIFELKLK